MQNFSLKQSVINKPIQVSDVLSILHRYGLPPHIHNLSLYQQAFIHTSAFNQRVEFLGDALLNAISSVFLYMKYKHHDEGFLTQKRQKVSDLRHLHVPDAATSRVSAAGSGQSRLR